MLGKYYENQEIYSFQARIKEIKDNKIYLNETYFYPAGGGQPSDIGTINGLNVIDVMKEENQIAHIIEGYENFKEGDLVDCIIDKNFRFNFMKQHTGQHLISAVAYKELNLDTVSVHMGENYITIEFRTDTEKIDLYKDIQNKVNQLISYGYQVKSKFIDSDNLSEYKLRRDSKVKENIRIVSIGDYDSVPCGGLHLENISILRFVKYIKMEKIRGNIRTYWKIGVDILDDYEEVLNQIEFLSSNLSCGRDEIFERIEKKDNQIKELKGYLDSYENIIANLYLEKLNNLVEIKNRQKILIYNFKDMGNKLVTNIIKNIDSNVFFTDFESKSGKFFWYIKSFKEIPPKELKKIISSAGGKGGGSKGIYQGLFINKVEDNSFKQVSMDFMEYIL